MTEKNFTTEQVTCDWCGFRDNNNNCLIFNKIVNVNSSCNAFMDEEEVLSKTDEEQRKIIQNTKLKFNPEDKEIPLMDVRFRIYKQKISNYTRKDGFKLIKIYGCNGFKHIIRYNLMKFDEYGNIEQLREKVKSDKVLGRCDHKSCRDFGFFVI